MACRFGGASQLIREKGTVKLDFARVAIFQKRFMDNIDRLKAALGNWALHRLFRFVIYDYGQDLQVSECV